MANRKTNRRKSKPAGYITARWGRGEFTPTGVNELGQPVAPLIISGRTYLYTYEAGEYELAKIKARNYELQHPTNKQIPYKERMKENVRTAKLIRSSASDELRRVRQATFLARMPEIVKGMQKWLKNPTPENKVLFDSLNEFIEKFNKLSEEEQARFYYENQEYFEDMTDYYQWLKEHSGRFDEDTEVSKRGGSLTPFSYVRKNVNSIKKITKRLDDYV